MSKRRKKMTSEEHIKLTMLMNFEPIFNRKWGTPGCADCRKAVGRGRDALVDAYMAMTPDERDPENTQSLMANPQAYAAVAAAVWLIDMIREKEMGLLPRCPSCGYQPADRYAQSDDEELQ